MMGRALEIVSLVAQCQFVAVVGVAKTARWQREAPPG